MDIRWSVFDDRHQNMLSTLAIKVELAEKQRFRPSKSVQHIVGLLKCANVSSHPEIKDVYTRFAQSLSPELEKSFDRLGLSLSSLASDSDNLSAKQVYRGTATGRESQVSQSNSESSSKGKKRVIYRGQVKWV